MIYLSKLLKKYSSQLSVSVCKLFVNLHQNTFAILTPFPWPEVQSCNLVMKFSRGQPLHDGRHRAGGGEGEGGAGGAEERWCPREEEEAGVQHLAAGGAGGPLQEELLGDLGEDGGGGQAPHPPHQVCPELV